MFDIRVVQKLQFLNNNRLKQQNAGHFARLVRQPTGLSNKSIIAVTNRKLCIGGEEKFLEQVDAIAAAGVNAIILREKDLSPADYEILAGDVSRICGRHGIKFIPHSFIGAAKKLNCQYLHLPWDAFKKLHASNMLGETPASSLLRFAHYNPEKSPSGDFLPYKLPKEPDNRGFFAASSAKNPQVQQAPSIGVSVHSAEDVLFAVKHGAAYLIAGHVFETDCKKGLEGRGLEFLARVCSNTAIPIYGIGGISENNIAAVLKTGTAGVCLMSSLMQCPDPAAYVGALRKGL